MSSEVRVVVTNPTGLHARPAVKLARLAAGFDADIEIRAGEDGKWVRARSTARVMKLKAGAQSTIHFRADGTQADEALSALVDFVRRDFDEGPAAEPPRRATETPECAPQPDENDAEPPPGRPATTTTTTRPREADSAPADPPASQAVHPAGDGGGRSVSAVVASPGLALGRLYILPGSKDSAREAGAPDAECAALDAAVARALASLDALAAGAGALARDIIDFQIALLRDEEFLDPVQSAVEAGEAADRAWTRHLAAEIADCESAPTAYLRDRAADLRDLRDRVATSFTGSALGDALPAECLVLAGELTPSRFLEIDWNRAAGVVTHSGSPASHVAMLARAHGVPMLVQPACDPDDLVEGTEAVIDADRGCLVLAPAAPTRERYARRIEEGRRRARESRRYAGRPARTQAGIPVRVLLNVDDPARLAGVEPSHCDGIGLTRTEFLFHRAMGLADEETQLRCYRQLLAWAAGRPVTVRTLDAGADKPVPGLTLEGEPNPSLGLRGVRLSLSRPEVFATQLRALARAAAGGEVRVMLPMVTRPGELAEARRLLAREVEALGSAGVEAAMPRLGMMVEVPAAALTVESFDADFFSIGTNDLTQYVLAADRSAGAVAGLLDPLHPGVLELVARVAEAGARSGREVSVCGEMAMQTDGLRALLEAGIRTFSVPPAAVASTKATLAAL